MKNPWLKISRAVPRTHSLDDGPIAERYPATDARQVLHTEVFPEPYLGRLEAPIVLLGLKPGFRPGDLEAHEGLLFQSTARASLAHEPLEYPLYLLDPAFAGTPGGEFYRDALKELANGLIAGSSASTEHAAWKLIANNVFVINFFPYHSVEAKLHSKPLTSQQYGFWLAREAMARQAIIVITLGESWWLKNVPSLRHYSRLFTANNTRSWTLSRGNLPLGFDAVLTLLGEQPSV